MRTQGKQLKRLLGAVLIVGTLCSVSSVGYRAWAQTPVAATGDSDTNDKYLWLEDVSSDRSMAWVKAGNLRSLKVLQADPHYAEYHAEALKLAEAPDRLAMPNLRGKDVYNFWRDSTHVNGILRKTTLSDYLSTTPDWNTVIDYDALGKKDKVKWVSEGTNCLYPGDRYSLVKISAGGEDANTLREFDLKSETFTEGGFVLAHSKQDVDWEDKDTLLVARDWGPGTMTSSGYPFVVKEWKRGTPLDSAVEVFRGKPTDEDAGAATLHDAQGHTLTVFQRQISFFSSQSFVRTAAGLQELLIPTKSYITGLLDGRVLLQINEDWTPAGQMATFKSVRCWK